MKVIKESLLKAIRLHIRQHRRNVESGSGGIVTKAKEHIAHMRDQALIHGDTYYDHPMNVTTPGSGAGFAAGAAFGIAKAHATRIKELKDRLARRKLGNKLDEGLLDFFRGEKKKSNVLSKAIPGRDWKPKEGESKTLYFHTSDTSGIKEFHPGTHFGTSRAARARLRDRGASESPTAHYTVRLKLGRGAKINDEGRDHAPYEISNHLLSNGIITKKERMELQEKIGTVSRREGHNHIHALLLSKGYDHMYYKNIIDHPGSTSVIITHPSQVRILKSGVSKLNQTRIRRDSASVNEEIDKSEFLHKKLIEEAPTNNMGSGNIAGGDPESLGVKKTKYKEENEKDTTVMLRRLKPIMEVKMGKFAGNDTFIVPSSIYHKAIHHKAKGKHWTKYLDEDDHHSLAIREYANKNPKKAIVLEDEKTGYLTFARYGKRQ